VILGLRLRDVRDEWLPDERLRKIRALLGVDSSALPLPGTDARAGLRVRRLPRRGCPVPDRAGPCPR